MIFFLELFIMNMDELTDLFDNSIIHDPYQEYDKLLKSQQFSVDELLMASDTVVASTNIRYARYQKYIFFGDDTSFIKEKIVEYFSTHDVSDKIYLIKQIDRMIIDYIETE